MSRRTVALLLVVLAAACGSGGPFPDDAFAFPANRDVGVGRERMQIAVSDAIGARLASPEIDVIFRVYPEGDRADAVEIDAEFIWAIPDVSGLYKAWIDFDGPGIWMIEVEPDGGAPLEAVPVSVLPKPASPAVGDPAPASATVTAADAPLEEITTDPDPDPRFYETSVAEAVGSGRTSVIAFATPRFCTSATCGPMLETLKEIAPRYPEVNWVHVEVYTNLDDPDDLEVVPAVEEWGLTSEPWVFVVDERGMVVGRFEGVVDETDLVPLIG